MGSSVEEIKKLVHSDIHQNVHNGTVFITTGHFTALADASTKYFLIDVTGVSSDKMAIVENVATTLSAEAIIHIYASPTISANGTEQTTVNANFLSSNTNELKIYADPTITANGTEIHTIYAQGASSGSGWSASVNGALTEVFYERILGRNIQMLFAIENVSGATMNYGTFIYRHREEDA